MRAIVTAAVSLTLIALSPRADARTVRDQPYSRETTWNAAIRLIRVDLGCPITERDVENGYFTFDWRDGRRTVPGSLEMVPTQIDGRPGTRVIVQISAMPSYVEAMVLSRLSRKLHTEFGEPAPPPPRTPPATPTPPAQPPAQPGIPIRPPTVGEPVDPSPPSQPPPPISPDAPRNPPRRSPND